MLLSFAKMHGLGNDFMVVDGVSQQVYFNEGQIRRLADRNRGVGFDQLLLVEPPQQPDVDFHYRIFNANGKEVEQCGNGARCLARFVRKMGLTWKHKLRISTMKGIQHSQTGEIKICHLEVYANLLSIITTEIDDKGYPF